MMVNERRKHPRISKENGMAVSLITEDAMPVSRRKETTLRLSKDISHGGLRLQSNNEFPLGSRIKVHMVLDIPRKIITHVGKVRWVHYIDDQDIFDVGIEFTDTPDTDMQIWNHYIDNQTMVEQV